MPKLEQVPELPAPVYAQLKELARKHTNGDMGAMAARIIIMSVMPHEYDVYLKRRGER